MAESIKKLEGKVAIVTGGASGIGEATAHLFADHGAKALVIADVQDEKGRLVAESIGSDRCCFVHCDVSDEEQVKAMVERTVQTYGQLDVMFSNAGIMSRSDQTILDLDFSEFDHLFATNVKGMAACVKQAARAMVERRVRGAIVCSSSIVATRGATRRTDYVMSKHATLGLVRSASRQLGVYGIRVNSVSPSFVPTDIFKIFNADPVKVQNMYEKFTSLKGVEGNAKQVADAVLFLVSEDSGFITGHDLAVDGGLVALPDADPVGTFMNTESSDSRE